MSSYIWVKSLKQTQKNNKLKVNIAEKNVQNWTFLTPPHPIPTLAKMIKCMRSDAMKYESDNEFTEKNASLPKGFKTLSSPPPEVSIQSHLQVTFGLFGGQATCGH